MKRQRKTESKRNLGYWASVCWLTAFVAWTALLGVIDVRPIGPQGCAVGLAGLNGWIHRLTGVNMTLYTVTDWLGLVPIGVAFGFALLGLAQWRRRKSLLGVDRDILALGGLYIAVMAVYVLFEIVVVNYRPVLIDGCLEASYPSSTTMLVTCVMPTAMMQWRARMKRLSVRRCVLLASGAFVVFMVLARLLSGVHWFTDIVGGILLSAGLVSLYDALARKRR